MKKSILGIVGSFLILSSFAQTSKVEDKLKILYAEEKYQDCAAKAMKYTEGKYKKDPIPYIYVSMSCLRMSQDNDLKEKFPKAFKDALSYAGKYRKKDKSGAIYDDYINHFEELKAIVAEEVENFRLEENKKLKLKAVKKGVGLMKKINTMDPDDKGAWLLRAVLEIESQNTMVGKTLIKKYLPEIKTLKATRAEIPVVEKPVEDPKAKKKKKKGDPEKPIKAFEEMTEMEQVNLRMGLMAYAEYLLSKKKATEATEIIEIGKPFFYEENELYQRKYNMQYKNLYKKING